MQNHVQRWKVSLLLGIVIMMSLGGCSRTEKSVETLTPPKAEKISKELTIHGHTRIDDYYWLNQRENQKVIDYLTAENQYKEAIMNPTEKLQKKLYKEIVGRIKKTDMSVPYKLNGFYYYSRYDKGGEYPIYARKEGTLEAEAEILLNVNEMAEGYAFYNATGLSVSEDNKLLAFGVDTVSRRKYTIYFKNLETDQLLADEIPNTTGRAVWANDNKTVFYVTKDSTLRPHKIFRHVLGTAPSEDVLIHHEKDNTFGTGISKSKSRKYLFIGSYHTLSSEVKFLDADNPMGKFKTILPREMNHEYSVAHYQDMFYIYTNYKAKNFRLMSTPVNKTAKRYWKEVIPHREDVLLQGMDVFTNYLVLSERRDGLTQIRIIHQKNQKEHYMDFEEAAYVAYPSTNPEMDTDILRYSYTSLTTPQSTFDYDMDNKEKTLLKQQEVLGKFDSEDYHAERHFATADDGTKVPLSLVYKKGLVKDGQNPALIYGYGSYGSSMDPWFRSDRLSLLDRGFVFAIAHIRGGQEMGRDWYEDGKLLKKKNTFTDFIDCAEYLIEAKLTNSEKLFAMGGSAGGLLMGAVYNMAPELFKGIIAGVPFVDVVTTMLDESIPLTTGEFDEWGNPKNKKYYEYMLSYSPYDNVEAKNYPAMLVTTGLHDSQVQYWEPAKWVAKLRDMKTDDNILLLHTNMDFGHGGASGRFERYKETALEYAFMLNLLGIKK